jgi:hypothetical protein
MIPCNSTIFEDNYPPKSFLLEPFAKRSKSAKTTAATTTTAAATTTTVADTTTTAVPTSTDTTTTVVPTSTDTTTTAVPTSTDTTTTMPVSTDPESFEDEHFEDEHFEDEHMEDEHFEEEHMGEEGFKVGAPKIPNPADVFSKVSEKISNWFSGLAVWIEDYFWQFLILVFCLYLLFLLVIGYAGGIIKWIHFITCKITKEWTGIGKMFFDMGVIECPNCYENCTKPTFN